MNYWDEISWINNKIKWILMYLTQSLRWLTGHKLAWTWPEVQMDSSGLPWKKLSVFQGGNMATHAKKLGFFCNNSAAFAALHITKNHIKQQFKSLCLTKIRKRECSLYKVHTVDSKVKKYISKNLLYVLKVTILNKNSFFWQHNLKNMRYQSFE